MSRFDCREAQRCLDKELAGDLSAADRRAMEAHLAFCEDCAGDRALRAAAAAVARDGELEPAVVDPGLVPRIGPLTAPPHPPRRRLAPWIAAVVMLLAIAGAVAIPGLFEEIDEEPVVSRDPPAEEQRHLALPDSDSEEGLREPPAPLEAEEDGSHQHGVTSEGNRAIRTEPAAGALAGDGLSAVNTTALELPAGEAPPTLDDLIQLAEAQRTARQYPEACDVYAELIERYPDSEAAGTALVAMGQVELGALARPERAIEHFDLYLERDPLGVLAEDARVGRVRAHGALGQPDALLQATEDYLAFHPRGGATPEVLRTRGDTLRQQGDCHRAVVSYRAVLDHWRESPHAAWAQEGLEACGGP